MKNTKKFISVIMMIMLSAACILPVYAASAKLQDGWGYSGSFVPDAALDDPLGFRGFGMGDNALYSGAGTNWPDEIAGDNQMVGGVYVEDTKEIWMTSRTYLVSFNTQTGVFNSFDMSDMTGITDDPGNILASTSFYGGAYDGRHIWFAPYRSNRVLRVDPYTGEGTALRIEDTAGLLPDYEVASAGSSKFNGTVFDGTNIWMIPCQSDFAVKINPDTLEMTAISLEDNMPSGSNIMSIPNGTKYSGGTFDGRYVWMAPYQADSILRIDITDDSISYIPLSEILGGSITDYNTVNYTSAIFDNKSSVYFIPIRAESMFKLDITSATPEAEIYPVLVTKDDWGDDYYSETLSTLNSRTYAKFRSATYDGENIWLTPSWDSDTFVRFNTTTNEYIAYNHYTALPNVGMENIIGLTNNASFYIGAVFDGDYVWFIPRASDRIVRLESYSQIEGTVTDQETGAPLSGISVAITNKTNASSVYYTLTTDTDGHYTANVPSLHDYMISVTLPEEYYHAVPGISQEINNIGSGQTETIDFALLAKGGFTVEKEIDTLSAIPQTFVYKVVFEPGDSVGAENIFYGTVTIPAGETTGSMLFSDLFQGTYTVTELDSNHLFQIDSGYEEEQSFYVGNRQGLLRKAEYLNNYKGGGWISGSDQITNELKELKE